jgi:hypothetical protein
MAGIFPRAPDVKVFCFFSSEKKNLPALSYCHFADLLLSLFLFESRA